MHFELHPHIIQEPIVAKIARLIVNRWDAPSQTFFPACLPACLPFLSYATLRFSFCSISFWSSLCTQAMPDLAKPFLPRKQCLQIASCIYNSLCILLLIVLDFLSNTSAINILQNICTWYDFLGHYNATEVSFTN
jgi:hypothetical protein